MLSLLYAADVADTTAGRRRFGQGAVGGDEGVGGMGVWRRRSRSRRVGRVGNTRMSWVRGLVVVVLVSWLLALFVLAVMVVGAVVVVVTRARLFFFLFDFNRYYDGVFEGHVRVWC